MSLAEVKTQSQFSGKNGTKPLKPYQTECSEGRENR